MNILRKTALAVLNGVHITAAMLYNVSHAKATNTEEAIIEARKAKARRALYAAADTLERAQADFKAKRRNFNSEYTAADRMFD